VEFAIKMDESFTSSIIFKNFLLAVL